MKDELKNINLLIDEFNKIAFIAQRKAFITIASEIQKEEIETIEAYRNSLFELKRKYVEHELNEEANLTFCLEQSLQSIQYELQMLINIKEDNMNEAWNNLVKAQVTYESVARNCPYESISANGYMRKLEYYEKILFPGMMFTYLSFRLSFMQSCNFDILKSRKQVVKKSSYQYFKKTIFQYNTKNSSVGERPAARGGTTRPDERRIFE